MTPPDPVWGTPLIEREYELAENQTALFPLGLGLAGHIRLLDFLVLSIGLNGPAAVGWGDFAGPDYQSDSNDDNALSGAARFDLTHMDILFLWPSVGLGLSIPGFRNLRIGASFSPQFAHLAFKSYAYAGEGSELETDLSLWDPFVPAGQIGFMLRLWRFDMGAQVRLSGSIDAEGDIGLKYFHNDDGTEENASAENARFEAPWPLTVFRMGIRYAHPREGAEEDALLPFQRELFDIELDFIFEQNSSLDQYDVTIDNTTIGSLPPIETSEMVVAHNWKNSYGVRLGGSVHLLRGMLTLSAGVSWDSAAVPEEFTRLDYIGWGSVGVAAGLTFRISIIELSIAYQHLFVWDRDVELPPQADPRSTQYDPDWSPCEERACALDAMASGGLSNEIINAGHYEASYDIIGMSLAFVWGRRSDRERDEEPEAEPEDEPEEEPVVEEPEDEPEEEPVVEEPEEAPAEEPANSGGDAPPLPEELEGDGAEEPAGEEAPEDAAAEG